MNTMDGGIGLALGTDGFKSYVEYLIERKIISKNSVNVFYDSSNIAKPTISLGLSVDKSNETRLGKPVNYLSSRYGLQDLS